MIRFGCGGFSVSLPRVMQYILTPTGPTPIDKVRLGVVPHKETYLMENHTQDDLRAHLFATDQHFRTLCEQHAQYSQLIEVIESKGHVTEAEEVEEHRLKKLKLHLKDEINEMLVRSRTASVS